ncbi:MAG TPA: DUF721 domain-containing protein [Acidimicrobiia bacterium]|jgi:hypothetical protein|nr:DUF721 domain-containing protein [Acidimicrobiia bacterium]
MNRDGELEHISESVDDMFTKLGLPDPVVMATISSEWDSLAGPPWQGRSKPLYLKGTTLVVEAVSPSMIAFLRYGEAGLVEKLADRLGPGVVETVDIRPPGTG